jgi:hypothetical protein
MMDLLLIGLLAASGLFGVVRGQGLMRLVFAAYLLLAAAFLFATRWVPR